MTSDYLGKLISSVHYFAGDGHAGVPPLDPPSYPHQCSTIHIVLFGGQRKDKLLVLRHPSCREHFTMILVNLGEGIGPLISVSSICRMSHYKVLSSSHTTQSRGGRAAASRNCGVGRMVSGMWSLWVMDEKAQKRSQDEAEFDAVMFPSRNGTQGEAGAGLKPLSVPKFRTLLLVYKNVRR